MNNQGRRILENLRKSLRIDVNEYTTLLAKTTSNDPFKILVATILSQNTSDKNSIEAYLRLERRIGVTPKAIANASLDSIKEAIKPAGLYERKSVVIKNLASIIIDDYQGDSWKLVEGELEEARYRLLSLPGVGRKTADVVLMLTREADVFPVDTHARRIALRLGIVKDPKSGYDEISRAYQKMFKGYCREAHLYIIALGRKYCKAGNPRCPECPIRELCATGRSTVINAPSS